MPLCGLLPGHVVALVGHVEVLAFRLDQDLDGIGRACVIGDNAAWLRLQRAASTNCERQNLAGVVASGENAGWRM